MGREELNLDLFRLCMFALTRSARANQCERHCFNVSDSILVVFKMRVWST